jgi:hemoglobin-like flavoprotein
MDIESMFDTLGGASSVGTKDGGCDARAGGILALKVELIRESLEVVLAQEDSISPRFYATLFSRYPEVIPLFSRNRPEQQQQMLQEAIVAVVDRIEDGAWLEAALGAMGEAHVTYGVRDEMYSWVGECLLAVLGEVAGDAWRGDYEIAWKEALEAIAERMLAGAAQARSRPD